MLWSSLTMIEWMNDWKIDWMIERLNEVLYNTIQYNTIQYKVELKQYNTIQYSTSWVELCCVNAIKFKVYLVWLSELNLVCMV